MKKEKNQVTEGSTEVVQKKKKKRKKAPIIIAILVVVFIVFRMVSCSMASNTGAIVTTTTAFRGDIQESISTSGTVSSGEKKVIFAPVAGVLEQVHVAAGDAVKAGDVLVSYNMEDMENQLQQASLQQTKSDAVYQGALADNSDNQAKLNEANTNLSVLEQQIADHESYLKDLQDQLAASQRETNKSLADKSYNLNKQSADLEQQLAALDKTDPSYEEKASAIQNQLQSVTSEISYNQYVQETATSSDYVVSMEKEIANVQENLSKMEAYKAEMEAQKSSSENTVLDSYDKQQLSADKELSAMSYQSVEDDYNTAKQGVVAEFDGIVTECAAVPGATVASGMQLLTLESSDNVKVTFDASKNDVEKLEVGQRAEVTISGNVYEGEVSKIDRMATVNASNTPMVGVEITLKNPDENIILGLDAKLTVYTDNAENALLIPVEIINADKDGDFLYVVENGVVVKKSIVCGISSDIYTEVLEGLTEEDQIIVSNLSRVELQEGLAVTVMPEQ